ncbi:serine/threonine-protein kinase [Aeoliella sp. ICT_H6.2]|uniref:Serine/threonine-protein kinase n=1 Tax=Aeoliella straminimaris TaxID=2954799 RepID=A0A9X2FDE5_9BACT|nr:serine/threonine-protein kinase [Aeoliella straminimaris]MCO6046905.1 serine/threonine-protein kinase [Aeoliella straminimaris]
MAELKYDAQSIFLDALEVRGDDERAAFLNVQCGANIKLREEVDELLRHASRVGNFLDPEATGTVDQPVTERPGDTIGPYKLLQQIGEGGMGVVYMAEQTEPIERRVALKIIKPGMDTRQVIARFEAERQALAMMDHPNIAKVLDAGVTETGRPYFVMELVRGVPITRYCDEHHLTPRQRLKLFIPVCQAIQHAHQKGIIHRDIKPSNVLVADYDDRPVPKVIDFGVAKATDHRLTEKTMFTEFGQVLGTFEYMSPEQAKLNQWDVDTRTDIYSLGVLLYELLAGEVPFDRQRLRSAAFDELLRIIREEDPPRPSTRASTSASLATIADNRKTEATRLGAMIRGELDWVVMKALDKDRSRRYETANGLAMDVERYLKDEPVVAGPPLARYRLAKFIKRNKVQVIAAAAVTAALVAALIGTTAGMVWAIHERNRADSESRRAAYAAQREAEARAQAQVNEQHAVEQQKIAERALTRATEVNNLITQMFASMDPDEAQGADISLLSSILDATSERLSQGEIKDEIVAASLHGVLGRVYMSLGLYPAAEKHLPLVVDIYTEHLGPEDHDTLNAMHNLAMLYQYQDKSAKSIPLYEEVLEIKTRVLGPFHLDTLKTMNNLAGAYNKQDRTDAAESLYGAVVMKGTIELGSEDPTVLMAASNLARLYSEQGRHDEAVSLLQNTLETQTRVLSPSHPDTLFTMSSLAHAHYRRGDLEEAIRLYRKAADRQAFVMGPDHSQTHSTNSGLSAMYWNRAVDWAEAGQWDLAAADWTLVLKRAPDSDDWASDRKNACRRIASWPEVFDRLTAAHPDETTLWIGRAQHLAERSRWDQAASHYARGFEARSLNDAALIEYAGVLLLTGDEQSYQRLCEEVAAKVAGPPGSYEGFVAARTACLRPSNYVVPSRLVQLAEERLAGDKSPWVFHVVGLARYRDAQYTDAMADLQMSNAGDWGGERAAEKGLNWMVLAMCHHQLGNPIQASKCYERATTLMATATPEPGGAASVPVPDWIEWCVLLHEAGELLDIEGSGPNNTGLQDSS